MLGGEVGLVDPNVFGTDCYCFYNMLTGPKSDVQNIFHFFHITLPNHANAMIFGPKRGYSNRYAGKLYIRFVNEKHLFI